MTKSDRNKSGKPPILEAIALPVIRPIPARSLVAGLSVAVSLISVFGYFVEVPRREYLRGWLEPVGGEIRIVAPYASMVLGMREPGSHIPRGQPVLVLRDVHDAVTSAQSVEAVLPALDNVTVLANAVPNGSVVVAGQLLTVLAGRDSPLQALLILPARQSDVADPPSLAPP